MVYCACVRKNVSRSVHQKAYTIIRFFFFWQTMNCRIREKIMNFPASWLTRKGNKFSCVINFYWKGKVKKYSGNRNKIPARGPDWGCDQDVSGQRRLAARTLQKKRWWKTKKIWYKAYKNKVTNLLLLFIDVYALWNFFNTTQNSADGQTPRCWIDLSRSLSLEFCYKVVGGHFCVKEETFAFNLWTMSLLFFASLSFASQWSLGHLEEAPSLIPTGKRVHGWQNSLSKQ